MNFKWENVALVDPFLGAQPEPLHEMCGSTRKGTKKLQKAEQNAKTQPGLSDM